MSETSGWVKITPGLLSESLVNKDFSQLSSIRAAPEKYFEQLICTVWEVFTCIGKWILSTLLVLPLPKNKLWFIVNQSNLIAATLYSSVSSSSLKLILVSVLACNKFRDFQSWWSQESLNLNFSDVSPLSPNHNTHTVFRNFHLQLLNSQLSNYDTFSGYGQHVLMCRYRPPRRHVLRWREIFHQTSLHPSSEASTDKPQ